jgi:hypothetical protein
MPFSRKCRLSNDCSGNLEVFLRQTSFSLASDSTIEIAGLGTKMNHLVQGPRKTFPCSNEQCTNCCLSLQTNCDNIPYAFRDLQTVCLWKGIQTGASVLVASLHSFTRAKIANIYAWNTACTPNWQIICYSIKWSSCQVPDYRSRGFEFYSQRYHIFCKVVCPEFGPLSLVRIIE